MKIAISLTVADTNAAIDTHFGRCSHFCIADTESGERSLVDNSASTQSMHGAGLNAVQTLAELGIQTVITGQLGPKAENAIRAAGISAWAAKSGTVDDVLAQLKNNQLEQLV